MIAIAVALSVGSVLAQEQEKKPATQPAPVQPGQKAVPTQPGQTSAPGKAPAQVKQGTPAPVKPITPAADTPAPAAKPDPEAELPCAAPQCEACPLARGCAYARREKRQVLSRRISSTAWRGA